MNRRVVEFLKKLPGLAVIVVAGTISYSVVADSINTQVTVANSAPAFSVAPAESPVSDTTTPTNVGNVVTFQATATDANNDSYRLAICKTNAITPNGVGAPTCDGGSWCVSSVAASGAQAVPTQLFQEMQSRMIGMPLPVTPQPEVPVHLQVKEVEALVHHLRLTMHLLLLR